MAREIREIKKVENKSKGHEVKKMNGWYFVKSGTSNTGYRVRLNPIPDCNCKWAKYQPQDKPVACSHVQAVIRWEAKQDGYSVKARPASQDTSHLKRAEINLGNGVKFTARRIA